MLLTNGAASICIAGREMHQGDHFKIWCLHNSQLPGFKIRFVSFLANSLFKDRQFIYSNRQYVVPNDEWLEMLIITSF
jgi:hypothetical protein